MFICLFLKFASPDSTIMKLWQTLSHVELQRLWRHGWLILLIMIASYAFFFSMTLKTLLVDGKITVLCQTNISQALYQKLQLTKMNFENCSAKNFPKTTIVIRFSLQVLSIRASSCTAVLIIPCFQVLSSYFYVSFILVTVPTVWVLINSATQLL